MGSALVDTSVWIDWFKKNSITSQSNLLGVYFEEKIPVYITPVILQEVLQGVREDNRFDRIKYDLLACTMLLLDPIEAAIGAATLYRTLRKKGVTIRQPNDCLIAHYAIFYDIPVLHSDVDFDQITRHTSLCVAIV